MVKFILTEDNFSNGKESKFSYIQLHFLSSIYVSVSFYVGSWNHSQNLKKPTLSSKSHFFLPPLSLSMHFYFLFIPLLRYSFCSLLSYPVTVQFKKNLPFHPETQNSGNLNCWASPASQRPHPLLRLCSSLAVLKALKNMFPMQRSINCHFRKTPAG